MPKRSPRIDNYIEAVQELARRHGLFVSVYQGKKNAIGFKVFKKEGDVEPIEVWVVHTTHGPWKKREVWSYDNLKKPAQHIMGATQNEFEEILASL